MNLDDELAFLDASGHDDRGRDETESLLQHQLITSPLLNLTAVSHHPEAFPSRGLLGTMNSGERFYINTNTPSCGVICGVQGSGKSHTLSCILEASLVADSRIGRLPQPLAALVFHFDQQDCNRPAEAAFLSCPASENASQTHRDLLPKVTILCSPSNVTRRRRAYASLPHIRVEPLYLSEQDLTADRMLAIMGCDNTETMPLYMHSALLIIRNMGVDAFNYREFKRQINADNLNPMQKAMVKLRLDLLDAFLHPEAPNIQSHFCPGKLVLVDLTDPFLDGLTAAVLFDIVLGSFIQWQSVNGKIVVLDEAHKYLINSDTSRLAQSISSIIRLQRHLAVRVIIATQEPTVIPSTVLDLASFIICHRFTSPSWCTHLARHVSSGENAGTAQWFQDVMLLATGQCVAFSPSALVMTSEDSSVRLLGRGYLKLRVRPRLTLDGGASLLAVGRSLSSIDREATIVDTPLTLASNDLPAQRERLDTGRQGHSNPLPTLISVPIPQAPPIPSAVPHSVDSGTSSISADKPASTSGPKAIPKNLKHLIGWLQRNGGANAPVSLNDARSKLFWVGKKLYGAEKNWWNPMLEVAEAEGLIEVANLNLKKKELKALGKERTIRLLHPGPFKYRD